VTDAQIEEFYNKNKERFAQPERRDLRIVLTKAEAKANEAKAALEDGQSWKEVAKKYSIDEASKSQGGKLPAQAEGTLEKALDAFVKEFQEKWKERTECREGYVTQQCKNAPKPTPTPNQTAPTQPTQPAPAQPENR
jgi:hypothetical protein